jgi:hypothetical protein
MTPDHAVATIRERAVRFKPTRSETLVICLTVAMLLALLSDSSMICRQHHSCALCRLARNDYRGFGRQWSEFEETECSKWYPENIERDHEHAWARSPSMQFRTIFGTPTGVADSDRPARFMKLTPTEQIAVYRHIPSADDAKRLFLDMRDDMENGDSSRYPRVRSRSGILCEWVDSGFRRPWDEVRTEFGVK